MSVLISLSDERGDKTLVEQNPSSGDLVYFVSTVPNDRFGSRPPLLARFERFVDSSKEELFAEWALPLIEQDLDEDVKFPYATHPSRSGKKSVVSFRAYVGNWAVLDAMGEDKRTAPYASFLEHFIKGFQKRD